MTEAEGHAMFDRAAEEFAAHPNATEPITDMMTLAFEHRSPTLRGWAAKWLKDKCHIHVVTEPDQGMDDAITTPAKGIL